MKNSYCYLHKPRTFRILIAGVFLLSAFSLEVKAPLIPADKLLIPPPRIIRTCCSFGVDLRIPGLPFIKITDITSIENLGPHGYLGNDDEGNGIIYSRRGGFIDMGHLRDCADWTAYIYSLILSNKGKANSRVFDLGSEGGARTLSLNIPQEFDDFDASQLAGVIAYDIGLWHEIATWYGVSLIPLIPERYSSFSPEDLYSNLLGVHLGIKAINSDLEYNEAMTQITSDMLDTLESVSTVSETYAAMEKVEDIWWSGKMPLPSKKILLKRYFDSDSCLMPWLVPDEKSELLPYEINKPDVRFSEFYELGIKVNCKFPIDEIFPEKNDRKITHKDFGIFMTHIRKDVEEMERKMAYRLEQKRKSGENANDKIEKNR